MSAEQRMQILQLAAKVGLSSVYDASHDTYTGWAAKVLAFAEQLKQLEKANETTE